MARGRLEGGGGGGTKSCAVAEPEYVSAKVSVWWDIENCHVPKGFEAHMIAQNISSALVNMNYRGPLSISAYGDTTKISPSVQQALNSTGISLNHVPAGVKDASDKKILVDMLFWAVDNPAPANYLLISGDRDFSNALHQLRMRRYNILLAHIPKASSVHLVAAAKSVWLWTSLVAGGPPLANKEASRISTNINKFPSSSVAMQTSGNSCVSKLPLGDQLAPNIENGTDTMNQGRPLQRNSSQCSISSTSNAVSASHNGYGNAHELGYGIPKMNSNNQAFSCNPNSTAQMQGSNPFLDTYTQSGFPNNGSNLQGSSQNPYPLSPSSTSFHMQPTPSHDFFRPPASHRAQLGPNTSTFISSPVACVPDVSKLDISEQLVHPLPLRPNSSTLTSGAVAAYVPDLSKLTINEHSARPLSPRPNSSICTLGSVAYEPDVSKLNIDIAEHSNISQRPPALNGGVPTPASAEGSNNQLTVNLPRKVYTVPKNPPLFKIKLSSKWSQSGQQDRPPVSSETCTTNAPGGDLLSTSGCPVPAELAQDLMGIVLALNTLKNEKIVPTEENITDCIRYGDPEYRSIDVQKALRSAVEEQFAVKHNIGSLQLYVGKDGRLWHFVNLLGGNIKDYSETIWDKVQKFLSSSTGHDAILATNCRYEAATVIKRSCLKELSLGEILQILHMLYINILDGNQSRLLCWRPITLYVDTSKTGISLPNTNGLDSVDCCNYTNGVTTEQSLSGIKS